MNSTIIPFIQAIKLQHANSQVNITTQIYNKNRKGTFYCFDQNNKRPYYNNVHICAVKIVKAHFYLNFEYIAKFFCHSLK